MSLVVNRNNRKVNSVKTKYCCRCGLCTVVCQGVAEASSPGTLVGGGGDQRASSFPRRSPKHAGTIAVGRGSGKPPEVPPRLRAVPESEAVAAPGDARTPQRRPADTTHARGVWQLHRRTLGQGLGADAAAAPGAGGEAAGR